MSNGAASAGRGDDPGRPRRPARGTASSTSATSTSAPGADPRARDRTLLRPTGVLGRQRPGLGPRLRPRDLREPRRLHLRRGERAARGDRGQARRAAQQAAVPRRPHGLLRTSPRSSTTSRRSSSCPSILAQGRRLVEGRRARTARPGSSSSASAATSRARACSRSPMGTPARELIYDLAGGVAGGRTLKACAPSGPSSGYLPASMLDLPLDWNALTKAGSTLGSGAHRRLRRPRVHARHGAQLGALLPQRVVRQVRALPRRLGQAGGDARPSGRAASGAARATCALDRRALATR